MSVLLYLDVERVAGGFERDASSVGVLAETGGRCSTGIIVLAVPDASSTRGFCRADEV